MAATSHVYPKAIDAINAGTIDLKSATAGAFRMLLCTGDASAWGATEQSYQYVSDFLAAYTEVATAGYARQSLVAPTLTVSGGKEVWSCASPVSFGSSITLTARSAAVYTTLVGSADASYPLISVIDFGLSESSSSAAWQFTVDPVNGLAVWNAS